MKAHILLVALATICTLVHAQCGGTFSGYSGSIISDPYTSDMYCIYVIAPPSSYYTHVEITFTSVSTEQGYDYVSVYDGQITSTSAELISKFSGWSIPPPFKSSQPYVTIIFQTDAYVNMDGWSLTYQYYTGTPPSCAGPRWLTDISNAVLSRTIHGNSSTYVSCDYIIEMPVYYYDNWYGSCKEYIQVALNSWDDSTQTAVADVYSGQNEWGIWYGSFQMGSESGDSINVQSEYGQAFIRYSVSTSQGSLSSYSMSVSMISECDSPSDVGVHTKVGTFLAWFLPLLLSLICITCVIVAIAYRSSKKRELHQTSKYQNMAVPLQTVPHTQDSQPVQTGPHPGSYVTVQQPYPNTTFPPNQMYMTPFNPAMYSSPVPMAQPAPGLFPPNVMLHTFQPLQPFPQQPSIQQGTQLPVVVPLEEHQ